MGYTQPVTVPLVFSATKKLNWDTVTTSGVRPVIKRLDIDALPSTPYDASGFKPLIIPPEIVSFDFKSLPDTSFDLEKIPAKSLHFKTSVLTPPVSVKAAAISPKSGTTISISDIGLQQGLPSKIILCLIKDKNGFIWIGADNGIYRYDGEYMRRYTPFGAADLIEDNDGKIWYINNNKIGFINPIEGTVTNSDEIHTIFPQLPKMILDSKGNIWVSRIAGQGANIIDPQKLTYKHLDRNSGLSHSHVLGIFQDEKKNIWLTTLNGADIINPERNKISFLKNSNGLCNDSLYAITGDNLGRVWIAFQNGGVSAVNIERGTITNYRKLQGLNNDFTYRLFYDNTGKLWIATDNGLSILVPEENTFRNIGDNEGIPEDFVLDFLQDDRQRVWIATYSAGIKVIDQNAEMVHPVGSKSLSTLLEDSKGRIWVGAGTSNDGIEILDRNNKVVRQLNKQNGLGDNFIQNFVENNGIIWIATDGGFDVVDLAKKTIEHTGKKEGLASDTLYGILRDKHANIWLTGPSMGIDKIDSARKMILHAGVKQGLSEENVIDIKSDKQGKVWIATYTKGIDVIDPEKGTITNLNQGPGLKDTCYRLLMPDSSGRMWIGTDKGIYIVDPQNNTLTTITTKEGLSDNYITSLVSYQDVVLAGTKNKVSIISPPSHNDPTDRNKKSDSTWKISLLAGSDGLVNSTNNWSTNIVTKEGQYLWGDNGITIIYGIKEQKDTALPTYITGITVMNEPQHFNNHLSLKEKDTLWNGSNYYVKGQVPLNKNYAQQFGLRWDSVSGPYNMPENLRIPYNQNYLQFQFGQLNLGSKEPTMYSYFLEGIDNNWSAPSDKTMTDNYLNLKPDNYTFKVSSKNITGRWGTPVEFKFTITPPWYQTWWAYTIFGLLILGFLRAYIVYRSRRLKKENKLLEEKVKHRTEQLQKSIEDLRSTQSQLIQSEKMASLGELTAGIAHEIQNPLNFVNNFSEVNSELTDELKVALNATNLSPEERLPIEELANDIKTNQEKISFHGKRADSIVKGMLQHSRSSNGQREPTNVNTLADEYLRLAYHGLRAKDKSFNADMKTDFDESIPKINIVAQDVGRVILNLITNAFYAAKAAQAVKGKGYEPTVWVSTKKENGNILVKVRDNGTGIPDKVKDKIFNPFFTTKPAGEGTGLGLSLSYDIIKVHGGHITVESKEGEGTEFTVELPST